MRYFFILLMFSCLLSFCVAEESVGVSLTIEVRNIKEIKGKIHIGVFGNKEDYHAKTNQVRKGSYAVSDHTLVVTYEGLPEGEYAVILFQDKNGNEINDSNALGIPLEPFGLSNNVEPGFSLPAFEKTKFKVDQLPVHLKIELQAFKKRWSVGLAAIVTGTPYVGGKVNVLPFPALAYQGDRLDLFGHIIRYTLYHDQKWNVALSGRLNLDGYNEDDDSYLAGLKDRKYTFEAGAEVTYRFYEKYFVTSDFYGDTLRVSHGMQGSFSVGREFGTERWKLTPTLAMEWLNRKYGDYYYGVQQSESRSDRAEYHPDDALNFALACSYLHFWGENWVSYLKVKLSYLDDEIQDSPIVDRNYMYTFIAAIAFRF